MNLNEVARMRAEVRVKQPANFAPVKPATDDQVDAMRHAVHALNVRVLAAPTVARPGRLERFSDWRRAHYVADQLMRVAAILAGAAALLALVGAALFWFVSTFAQAMLLVGGGIVLVTLLGALLARTGSPKSGWGFHWSKCDH